VIPWVALYEPQAGDDEAKLPTIRSGIAEGFAVSVVSTIASTIGGQVIIEFTEE
jgi:hypothetical protein